jgi:NADH-quinone oxidoreductase subunit L
MEELSLLRWIPLIPLLGTVINIFIGNRLGGKNAGLLASAAVALSFLLSLRVFWLLSPKGILRDTLFTWIESGSFQVAPASVS